MGADKRFCHECAEEGKIPIGEGTMSCLLELRDDSDEWIELVKHRFTGWNGEENTADCVTIESAISLQKLGYTIEELDDFIDTWQDVIFDHCDDCGRERQWIVNTHGERYCTDCA